MKKLLFLIPLLMLWGCNAYEHQVATDCPNGPGSGKYQCVSDVPPYIEEYVDMLEKDTMALFRHMRFIVEEEDVHWVYRMESQNLQIDSRYRTAKVEQWRTTLIWFFGIAAGLVLLILLVRMIQVAISNAMSIQYLRKDAAQAEMRAAEELQKAGISVGTRESDLIAKQAMMIDSLTEQNDMMISEEMELNKEAQQQRAFNAKIYIQACDIEKREGAHCSEEVLALVREITSHCRS